MAFMPPLLKTSVVMLSPPKLHTYPTTFFRNFCRKHHHNGRQREKTRMKMFFLTTIRVHKAGFWGVVFISQIGIL